MGVIQNSINQALGSVAGAALGIKHTEEAESIKANSAENSALVARNQSREADAAAYDARVEVEGPGGLKEQKKEAKEKVNKAIDRAAQATAMNDVYPSPMNKGKMEKRIKEVDAAKKALEFLSDSLRAKTDVIERATEQRLYANKLTERAINEQAKFKSRWGGRE